MKYSEILCKINAYNVIIRILDGGECKHTNEGDNGGEDVHRGKGRDRLSTRHRIIKIILLYYKINNQFI